MDFPLKELEPLPSSATLEQLIEARNADAREHNAMVRHLRANQLIDGTGITWVRSNNGVKPKLGTITATCSDPGPGFDIEIKD